MNSRMYQLRPAASTRFIRLTATSRRWISAYGDASDIGFLGSWFEDDSPQIGGAKRPTNWGAISGVAISLAISGTFWAGVAIAVARVLR